MPRMRTRLPVGAAVDAVAFVRAEQGPAHRHAVAGLRCLPLRGEVIDVHARIGERGQPVQHELHGVVLAVQLAARSGMALEGRRVEPEDLAEHPAVPDVVPGAADEVLDVEAFGGRGRQRLRRQLALAAFDGALDFVLRATERSPAFGDRLDELGFVQAELAGDAQLVAHQPLLDDAVLFDDAVGDDAIAQLAARGRAVDAAAAVMRRAGDAVRGVVARLVVAAPDHVVGEEPAVGEHGEGLHRARHDRLDAVGVAAGPMHQGVVRVVGVDQSHLLLFPDLVRAADDVIDDVHVVVIEPAHPLPFLGTGVHRYADVTTGNMGDRVCFSHEETLSPAPAQLPARIATCYSVR